MANELTPQLEAIVDKIGTLVVESLRDGQMDQECLAQLIDALSVNGWTRHVDRSVRLRDCVKQQIIRAKPEPTMHRGAELEALLSAIQSEFNSKARYSNQVP